MAELGGHRDQCNGLYTEVLSALRYLDDLNSQYVNVSTKTNALHDACEHLLSEQVGDQSHLIVFSRIDPSWSGPIELFLVPSSAPRLVSQRLWYVLSCLWDSAYKRTLSANQKE